MQRKVSRLGYSPTVLEWSEGVEENETWQDAWQPEGTDGAAHMQIEAGDHASQRTVAVARTGPHNSRRVQVMDNSAVRRITPLLADGTTPALPAPLETNPTTSRCGRAVRRPGVLAEYML